MATEGGGFTLTGMGDFGMYTGPKSANGKQEGERGT